ncbi:hypothetical protein NDU88_002847 [Pleurodeles waltl]|uniref:Uncharacterized protein n=1 Tax=Pleurodeles waltl TaxID=8319 RepID=A0AAV7KWT4_PLEWA|nr:hypothetical protein NDU88_002847 [Pleurodeles waltl]
MTIRKPQRVAIKFPSPRLLACFIKIAAAGYHKPARGLRTAESGPDALRRTLRAVFLAGKPLSRGPTTPIESGRGAPLPGLTLSGPLAGPTGPAPHSPAPRGPTENAEARRTPASSLSRPPGAPGFSSPQALQPRTRHRRRRRPRQRAGSNAEAHPGAVSPAAILGDPPTRSHPAFTALTARTEPALAPEASPRSRSSQGRPGQHGRPLDGGF